MLPLLVSDPVLTSLSIELLGFLNILDLTSCAVITITKIGEKGDLRRDKNEASVLRHGKYEI